MSLLLIAPVSNGQPVFLATDFFPLQEGATWIYQRTPGGDFVIVVVEGLTTVDDVITYRTDTGSGDIVYYSNDQLGLRFHRLDTLFPRAEVTFTPPIVLANTTIQIGDEIETAGTASFAAPGAGRFELQYETNIVFPARETLEVPAGTFDTLRMEYTLRLTGTVNGQEIDDMVTEKFWLAPNVGIVRDDAGPFGVLNLVETTLRNDDYQISAETSGLWYNSQQSGHGLVVQVIEAAEGQRILVYWFANLGGAQVWLGGVGDLADNVAHVPLIITGGTGFPPDFHAQDVVLTPWGDLTLAFADDGSVEVGWITQQPGFLSGGLAMTRLTRIADPAVSTSCISGAYYNLDQNGHGILAEVVRQGEEDVLVVTWFVYLEGEQAWLQGIGTLVDNRAELDMIRPIGSTFPPEFDAMEVALVPWGTATFEFEPPDRVRMSWETDQPGFEAGTLHMNRLTVLAGHACPNS